MSWMFRATQHNRLQQSQVYTFSGLLFSLEVLGQIECTNLPGGKGGLLGSVLGLGLVLGLPQRCLKTGGR